MRPAKAPDGKCPQDADRQSCPLTCKYNHFESEDLTIDAWELKCLDCGWRETIGFRSDEMDEEDDDRLIRPFARSANNAISLRQRTLPKQAGLIELPAK